MVNILSNCFILIWLLFHCDAAVIPQQSLLSFDDEGPFSSNKNPESAYVASLANIAYNSIILPSTCTSLGLETEVCETISSTVTSSINIYWAKSDNKTDLQVVSNGKSIIGPENRNVLAIKPISISSSPVFLFFFGDRFQKSSCLRDHGKIIDHGQGKCLIYCIQRNNHLHPTRTNLCTSSSLPSAHFAVVSHESRNLIRCVDGILGAAPC